METEKTCGSGCGTGSRCRYFKSLVIRRKYWKGRSNEYSVPGRMDLKEVSIIDNRKIPCYASTSIEMRADGNEVLEVRTLETKVISSEQKEKVDYSKYEATIRRLGGKS